MENSPNKAAQQFSDEELLAKRLRLVSQQACDMGDWQSHQEAEDALHELEPKVDS